MKRRLYISTRGNKIFDKISHRINHRMAGSRRREENGGREQIKQRPFSEARFTPSGGDCGGCRGGGRGGDYGGGRGGGRGGDLEINRSGRRGRGGSFAIASVFCHSLA
jgi:hypothetical protein